MVLSPRAAPGRAGTAGHAGRAGSWEREIQTRSTDTALPCRARSQTGRIRCCVGACCQDAEPRGSSRCRIGWARHQKGYPERISCEDIQRLFRISRCWLGYLEWRQDICPGYPGRISLVFIHGTYPWHLSGSTGFVGYVRICKDILTYPDISLCSKFPDEE
jgi:hypothetical protein